MNSHCPTHWQRGFLLALTTAFLWGVLPVALVVSLTVTDPYTLTWLRFVSAALLLGVLLAKTRSLPDLKALRGSEYWLLIVALLGLLGNFVLFVTGLHLTTPAVAQVVCQLSPVFLLLGGVLVFGERLSGRRWLGFVLLLAGILLFFNRRLPELTQLHASFGGGVALVALGSLVWACFGLAQKRLLRRMQSQQILWLLYIGSVIALLPVAAPGKIGSLSGLQAGMLAFCCLNTVVAYGALAEAMRCWDVSRVSAVLSLTPLFTIYSAQLFNKAWPGIVRAEPLNGPSIAGALLVVGGSALCALGASSRGRAGVNP